MKYLVESDKERQAEPPVDPIDAFFKSIAATVKVFLLIIKTFASQEYLRLYLKWKWQKFYKKPSLRFHQNILLALQMNLGYYNTAFVMQILFQPGRQNLRN